jgi:DNA/RNA endonuclease YhcR with UshA esterase domain
MDKTLDLVALSPWLAPSLSSGGVKKYTPAEAKEQVGKSITVAGRVVQVVALEKVAYLNLGKPHPDTPFTAVVFAASFAQFGTLTELEGKIIEVSGKVIVFKERAEIVVNSANQVKVVE